MPKTQEELIQLKIEYETLNNKLKELTKEELNMVTGGWSRNEDGTYNIYVGDCFRKGRYVFTVEKTVLNAKLDTDVACEWVREDENGMLKDWGGTIHTVDYLLNHK